MAEAPVRETTRMFPRWIRASFLGWFLGFVLLLALVALAGLFGGGAQFMVGVGMGAGVGFMQGRLLSPRLGSPWPWTAASTIGMGTPFVLHDLSRLTSTTIPLEVHIYVLVGGLLTGILQYGILRRVSRRSILWVPASIAGWALPAGAVLLGTPGTLPDPWSTVVSMFGMFFGGLLLGAVTGPVVALILKAPASSPGRATPEESGA